MKLNDNEKNVFEALWLLIQKSGIKITATSLKNAILQTNQANTMLGLCDILYDFNIPNLATKISPEQLYEIPLPAIVHFDAMGGTFATLTKIENDTVEWVHEKFGIHTEKIHNFTQKWRGITLLIEPNQTSGETNYKENRNQEIIENLRLPFIITGLLICLGIVLFPIINNTSLVENWQYYALFLTKSIGLAISCLLIWYSFDSSNSFLQTVCQLNNKTNCNNILNSEAAKIFHWLSWSEIGIFYFAGGFLSLLINPTSIIPLWVLGGFAIIYTFWSIYYQGIVAKEWCPLCLGIQILLWLEFLIFAQIPFSNFFTINSFPFKVLGAFLITPSLWALIKPHFLKSVRVNKLHNEFQKLKFNSEYLETLFNKESSLPPIFEGMNSIRMGNSEAMNTLTMVLEPTCFSCRQSYWVAKNLVEIGEDIQIQIVLAPSLAPTNEGGQIVRQILSQDPDNYLRILDEWFGNSFKNKQKWIERARLKPENQQGMEQAILFLRWLELAGITEAPIKFLNNHEIPKIYMATEIVKLMRFSKVGFANQK